MQLCRQVYAGFAQLLLKFDLLLQFFVDIFCFTAEQTHGRGDAADDRGRNEQRVGAQQSDEPCEPALDLAADLRDVDQRARQRLPDAGRAAHAASQVANLFAKQTHTLADLRDLADCLDRLGELTSLVGLRIEAGADLLCRVVDGTAGVLGCLADLVDGLRSLLRATPGLGCINR